MPSSRPQPPPQTSKQARKAYLRSSRHFEFTGTQKRASERRLELDKRAQALQAKEQRKKDNKRKREDKEAAERESKRRRIESGKAPKETLWGKVRASQPRLTTFFAQPKAEDKEADDRAESEDEGDSTSDYDLNEEIIDRQVENGPQDSATETKELENFFSSAASIQSDEMSHPLDISAGQQALQHEDGATSTDSHHQGQMSPSPPCDPEQALLDAQLSLSQGMFDFDIAEDDDAEWMAQPAEAAVEADTVRVHDLQPQLRATPSKRKAENCDLEFASPAKSARSALSEMSPSKVNIRAQEKPDISSVASFSSMLPTPSPAKQASSQGAAEVLAMIATQDLEDDEFAADKENEDPWQVVSKRQSQKRECTQRATASSKNNLQITSNSASKVTNLQAQGQSFDEDIFDLDDFDAFDSGLETDQDEYDNDVDEEALVALAAESPSKQKSNISTVKSPSAMTPKALNFRDIPAPLKPATLTGDAGPSPSRVMPPPRSAAAQPVAGAKNTFTQHQQPAVTQGNSFAFEDVEDDDLTAFAEELDTTGLPALSSLKKRSRTIPWNRHSLSPLRPDPDELQSQDKNLQGS